MDHLPWICPTGTNYESALLQRCPTASTECFKLKRPGKMCSSDCLLGHDNVPTYTTLSVQQYLVKNNMAVVWQPCGTHTKSYWKWTPKYADCGIPKRMSNCYLSVKHTQSSNFLLTYSHYHCIIFAALARLEVREKQVFTLFFRDLLFIDIRARVSYLCSDGQAEWSEMYVYYNKLCYRHR
jgi:hypothetical protein